MDARLQTLIDRSEILDVLHQYARGCDRGDEQQIADAYHPEARDNHGKYDGNGREFAKIVCRDNYKRETMSHLLGQSAIHINGNSAGTETYFTVTIARREAHDVFIEMHGGRYVDKLERRDGQWRILDRLCTCEWSLTSRVEEWLPHGEFVQGTFDKTDRSYETLG